MIVSSRASVLGVGGLVGTVGAALAVGSHQLLGGAAGGVLGAALAAALGAAGARIVLGMAARIEPPIGTLAAPHVANDPGGRSEMERRSLAGVVEALAALGDAAGRMADGASEQAGAVPGTTNSVEALSDRIDRISRNAEEAAAATDRTRQQATMGQEQIRAVIEGMDNLRSQVESNARKARRLGERSVEIGAIVELIGEVSNRTDMLALNATIESVRAGEHGRGFAVVAEEIRKLAERSAAATREIGTLIEAIQADSHESIRALAEEQAEMEKEVRSVREVGSALERICRMAEDSARLVDGISHSANDQVLVARDLVTGMQRISEVSKRILAETGRVRREARGLSERSEALRAPAGPASPAVGATSYADESRRWNGRPGRDPQPRSIEAMP